MVLYALGRKERKKKFTLFSDYNGSLLRRQPGAYALGIEGVVHWCR